MKRILRILILGPVFLIASVGLALVLLPCCLFVWLIDESAREFVQVWRDIEREAWGMVWRS